VGRFHQMRHEQIVVAVDTVAEANSEAIVVGKAKATMADLIEAIVTRTTGRSVERTIRNLVSGTTKEMETIVTTVIVAMAVEMEATEVVGEGDRAATIETRNVVTEIL